MPELPEVEALATYLEGVAVGRVIASVDVLNFSVLKTYDPPITALAGRTVRQVTRHGKFLAVHCAGEPELLLVFHLARAGWLRWHAELPGGRPKSGKGPLAMRVRLSDGAGFDITEAGTQKKVAAYVVTGIDQVPGVARLGIDPLAAEFTQAELGALLAGRRTQLKGVLRDQTMIAGIGNAYSDEILHAARMSPFRVSAELNVEDVARLHDAVRTVLTEAMTRTAGVAAGELKREKKSGMAVHGRTGEACPVCGDTVREVSFADSALQYCPTCQTGGKVLADRRLSKLLK